MAHRLLEWNGPNISYTISGRRDKQQREIQSACLATIRLVYSPRVAISVMPRIK